MVILFDNPGVIQPALGVADASEAVLQLDVPAAEPIESITIFEVPDSDALIEEVLPTVTKTWAGAHSTEKPRWVAASDPTAAAFFAANYGCPVKDFAEAMLAFQEISG